MLHSEKSTLVPERTTAKIASFATLTGGRDIEALPTFSLNFPLGTPMQEIHNSIINLVLQAVHGNRLQAAQLLQINPRTIRRRLGRKKFNRTALRRP